MLIIVISDISCPSMSGLFKLLNVFDKVRVPDTGAHIASGPSYVKETLQGSWRSGGADNLSNISSAGAPSNNKRGNVRLNGRVQVKIEFVILLCM